MSQNNSLDQTAIDIIRDLYPEGEEEQYHHFLNLLNRQPDPRSFFRQRYRAPLVMEENRLPESGLPQPNIGSQILTTDEQLTINTNNSNLQTEINSLRRELFDAGLMDEEEYDNDSNDSGSSDNHNSDSDSSDSDSSDKVDNLLETSSYIEIKTLEPNDLDCTICQSEFGKERKDSTEPALEPNQGLPGEELAEYPIKLPCGHVFGQWCIREWLRNARFPSCPVCRSRLDHQ